jgi:hypothetical protein
LKADGEFIVSPKMSSLAIDDIHEMLGESQVVEHMPELYVVVKSPYGSRNHSSSSIQPFEEVVYIGGRFTVSF